MRTNGEDPRVVLVTNQSLVYNETECFMLTLRDLTEYYELGRVKQEANNLKFLNSTTTHEMMTPLSCIVMFTERLMNQITDPEQRELSGLIWRTSKLLKSYILDLLDRNLIEKGKLVPSFSVANLTRVVDEVVEMMQYQASLRDIKIDWNPGNLGDK